MKQAKFLSHLTDRELASYLAKRGVNPIEARQVRDKVAAYKAEQRSATARKRMVQDLWRGVLAPLSAEQRNVRAMLRYESQRYPNPKRREVLNAYAEVMKKLNATLREYRYKAQRTPKEQAAYLQTEKGKIIPNNGEHWTDWVPAKIKNAIIEAFIDIPRAAKAKAKTPFPRTITRAENAKLKATHIITAKRELLKAEQELSVIRQLNKGEASDAEHDAQAKVNHIQNIINWLIVADDDEEIPRTWGELNVAKLSIVKLPVVND